MIRTLLFALSIAAAFCNAALARNTGVIAADDPNRPWFSRPKVHACCDYSDGRFVPFRVNDAGKYEVQIDGKWWVVPDAAVRSLDGEKNPYLEALAWYGTRWSYEDEDETQVQVNTPDIRCFIPGAGT